MFLAAVGLGFLAMLPGSIRERAWLDAAVGVAFGLGCLRLAVPDLVGRLRVHDEGVARRGLSGWRQLRYDEVAHVAFRESRSTDSGYYTGTHVGIRIRAGGGAPLEYQYRSTRGGEPDLRRLRDHITRSVSQRMADRLRSEGRVPVAEVFELTDTGIRERAPEGREVDYARIRGWHSDKDVLLIFEEGHTTPLRLSTQGEDFFPGLLLLEALVGPEKAASNRLR